MNSTSVMFENPLVPVATALGVSLSQLTMIVLFFVSIPLSLVFPFLPSTPKSLAVYLYSFFPAIWYLWTLGLVDGFFQLLFSALVSYVIIRVGLAYKVGRIMPWSVFIIVMGHLLVVHTIGYRRGLDNNVIDVVGAQMVLVMKLISFAWSCYDGSIPLESLDAQQTSTRITVVPSLIAFLGYIFYFPSILAGPSFAYTSYESFTSHALWIKETGYPAPENPLTDSRGFLPAGRKRKALKRGLVGVVFLGLYSVYGHQFSYNTLLTSKLQAQSFINRFVFLNIAGYVARFKYFAVWCLAESAYILSGLGYNPKTSKYDASRNVRIRSILFAPNFKILLDAWNINTNIWLRECIYKRLVRKGRKPGFWATQATFATSAIWHGVNPCYLMTFILGGFCQSTGRKLRKHVRPLFLAAIPISQDSPTTSEPPKSFIKSVYDIICIINTQIVLNFIVAPFLILTSSGSIEAWRTVNWYGIYLIFGPFLFFAAGGGKLLELFNKPAAPIKEPLSRKDLLRVEKQMRRDESSQGLASLGMDVERLVTDESKAKSQ